MSQHEMLRLCPWMLEARRLLGSKEIPGKITAPFIATMLARLGAWWQDDETPWCATFVSWCLQEAQVLPPKAFYRAHAFTTWGIGLPDYGHPSPYGAVVVTRRPGGFHVGFLTGVDRAGGRVQLLGGNQNNQVCFAPFNMDTVVAVRYPWVKDHWQTPGYMACTPWMYRPMSLPSKLA